VIFSVSFPPFPPPFFSPSRARGIFAKDQEASAFDTLAPWPLAVLLMFEGGPSGDFGATRTHLFFPSFSPPGPFPVQSKKKWQALPLPPPYLAEIIYRNREGKARSLLLSLLGFLVSFSPLFLLSLRFDRPSFREKATASRSIPKFFSSFLPNKKKSEEEDRRNKLPSFPFPFPPRHRTGRRVGRESGQAGSGLPFFPTESARGEEEGVVVRGRFFFVVERERMSPAGRSRNHPGFLFEKGEEDLFPISFLPFLTRVGGLLLRNISTTGWYRPGRGPFLFPFLLSFFFFWGLASAAHGPVCKAKEKAGCPATISFSSSFFFLFFLQADLLVVAKRCHSDVPFPFFFSLGCCGNTVLAVIDVAWARGILPPSFLFPRLNTKVRADRFPPSQEERRASSMLTLFLSPPSSFSVMPFEVDTEDGRV